MLKQVQGQMQERGKIWFLALLLASLLLGGDTPIDWLCAGKGMVFKPFGLVKGLVITENWSSTGSRLTGSLIKD